MRIVPGRSQAPCARQKVRNRADGEGEGNAPPAWQDHAEEIHDAEVNDMPPRYRLACQCFIRNEDILVAFEGDETLPEKPPYLTPAAKKYKGGFAIASLDEFLGYAVKVEEDAAIHYEELSVSMEQCGNHEVAKLLRQLGRFSRLHLAEARSGQLIDVSKHVPPARRPVLDPKTVSHRLYYRL